MICERCNKGRPYHQGRGGEEERKGRDYMRVEEEIDRDGWDARVDSVMRPMRMGDERGRGRQMRARSRGCGQLVGD